MNKKQSNLEYKKGYGDNYANLRKTEYNGKGKNFTVRELEKLIGVSYTAINLIEKEKREPTVEQVLAYKHFFGVSLDYLTGESNATRVEMTEICKVTGLTEKAVNTLRNLKNHVGISFPDIDYLIDEAKERKNRSKEEWNRIVEESPKLKIIESCVAKHNYEDLPKEFNQALGIYVSSLDEEDIQLYTRINSELINACLNTLNTVLESEDIYDFLRFLDVYINMDFNHRNNSSVKSYGKFFISSDDNDEHETLSTLYISDNELKLVLFEKFRIFLDSLKGNNPTYHISDISREYHAEITGTLK